MGPCMMRMTTLIEQASESSPGGGRAVEQHGVWALAQHGVRALVQLTSAPSQCASPVRNSTPSTAVGKEAWDRGGAS